MIAAARVRGFDDELVAIEGEFLDRARRGDHKTLAMLTAHFRNCARADGSKPTVPDGVTVADVGDRGVLRGDFAQPGLQTVRDALEAFTRPPTVDDGSTLAHRQAEGLIRICEIALATRDRRRRCPARRVLSDPGPYSRRVGSDDDGRVLRGHRPPRTRTDPLRRGDRAGDDRPVGSDPRPGPRDQRLEPRHPPGPDARSPQCQWPGCETPAPWCDAHHFVHWEHGGETSLANGVHLCRRHHVFLHQHRDWHFTFDHQQSACSEPTAPKSTPTPGTTSRPDVAPDQAVVERGDAIDAEPGDERAALAVAAEPRAPVGAAAVADLDLARSGRHDHLEAHVAVVAPAAGPVGIVHDRDPCRQSAARTSSIEPGGERVAEGREPQLDRSDAARVECAGEHRAGLEEARRARTPGCRGPARWSRGPAP